MSNHEGDSSPLSPRTTILHAMITIQFQTLQRQMEQMKLEYDRRLDNRAYGYSSDSDDERGRGRQMREAMRGRRREDNKLEGVKIKVPTFIGKNDLEAYLERELKIEQLQKERRKIGAEPIDTWEEMMLIMRRLFVHNYYQRDIHNKLQRLTQGSKSVDEYFKEMELALLRSNFHEDREATMARFLHGLNQDIQDIIELQHYVELDDLVQQAIKVEDKLRRKKSKFSSSSSSKYQSSRWVNKLKKESPTKEATPSTKGSATTSQGKLAVVPIQRSRDVKCFKCLGLGHIASQCPTRKTMIMNNGEIESQSEASSDEEGGHEEDDAKVSEGDLLVVRRLLGGQIKDREADQRGNIFHTRCLVGAKVCCLIIDSGSCTNVASTRIVSILNLETKTHPTPYRLQWLSEVGEMLVGKQVEVPFTIGSYEDSVLCNVVDMEASHLLLGRSWQYDKKATHGGRTNKPPTYVMSGLELHMYLSDPIICIYRVASTVWSLGLPLHKTFSVSTGVGDELQSNVSNLINTSEIYFFQCIKMHMLVLRNSIPRKRDNVPRLDISNYDFSMLLILSISSYLQFVIKRSSTYKHMIIDASIGENFM
ncbi:PREDICTED: uncharacterized protein LOC109326356 [Lupinus angustifolius]|uniref:uncharacterized protein LOC109326356 n=1 Tax=Lupinus angustifolius TaxID=3871 RepID=UPI00092F8258|nr:PREDICTED: uncharacterized protein LOC109326356 [Lupinus angustifolius]